MTDYSHKVAILTNKVTQVMVDQRNLFYAVKYYCIIYGSGIIQVRLRVIPLKSWDFVYLPEPIII